MRQSRGNIKRDLFDLFSGQKVDSQQRQTKTKWERAGSKRSKANLQTSKQSRKKMAEAALNQSVQRVSVCGLTGNEGQVCRQVMIS